MIARTAAALLLAAVTTSGCAGLGGGAAALFGTHTAATGLAASGGALAMLATAKADADSAFALAQPIMRAVCAERLRYRTVSAAEATWCATVPSDTAGFVTQVISTGIAAKLDALRAKAHPIPSP